MSDHLPSSVRCSSMPDDQDPRLESPAIIAACSDWGVNRNSPRRCRALTLQQDGMHIERANHAANAASTLSSKMTVADGPCTVSAGAPSAWAASYAQRNPIVFARS
uniref:Uncharacterized protein n=1 Tax=Haptolina brevifila TaxID=156173 RepID=A0A7S2FLH6_9EUKA|mmetsp:Transcript_15031/g.30182  ORF Transcript_15031/g.30182 Transcript_15031/m.30182 type:complete len:106 (+) Transcript_15031:129-446(+)